jgi:hypothetical protein
MRGKLADRKLGRSPLRTSQKAAGIRCWVIPTTLTRSCDFSDADKVLSCADAVTPALVALGVAWQAEQGNTEESDVP